MASHTLEGLTIGITADRRADEQAYMLTQRGAKVVHAPVIRSAPIADLESARRVTGSILRTPPDVIVVNTALGVRTWLALVDTWGMADEMGRVFADAYVASRGAKAAGALAAAGLDVDWRAPTSTLEDVVRHLGERDLAGRRVVLQVDGRGAADAAVARLHSFGASVLLLATYRWALPDDRTAAHRLVAAVCDATVDAVTFTAAPAVENFVAIADACGRGDDLRAALSARVLAMCVGPVCRRAALDAGVPDAREPSSARLGTMVKDLAEILARRRRTFDLEGHRIEVQGSVVRVGGHKVDLTDREKALFGALARKPGTVVARGVLLGEVWGDRRQKGHAVEVAVGRLRRKLDPTGLNVVSVARRGYRLSAARPVQVDLGSGHGQ